MRKYIYSMMVVGSLLAMNACGKKANQQGQAQNQPTPAVTVQIPTENITTFVSYPTTMQGVNNSEARPKIQGYITQVLVDEGQRVKKGQILFRLETQSLTQQADAARAAINSAQVQVNQLKPLVQKNIISKNQLAVAEANLSQARANYRSIVANIDYGVVRSPVDGYVGQIRIKQGNLVGPNDPTPLTTISEINKIYAYFSLNESDYLNFLKTSAGATREQKIQNMPAITLMMANGQEYPEKGKVQTIDAQVDPSTGTIAFRASFNNPDHLLNDGSTGTVQIPKLYENVVVVPQSATFEQQGRVFVMKVDKTAKGETVNQQAITVLDTKDNLYLVGSGIKAGDVIVAEGVDKIKPGTMIKPTQKSFEEISKPLPVVFK